MRAFRVSRRSCRVMLLAASLVIVLAIMSSGQNAKAMMNSSPPYLVSFDREYIGDDHWIISGVVTDDDVGGCVIHFGMTLENCSCWVNSDGTYSITLWLPPGWGGVVSARAQDGDGLWSNERYNDIPTYF